MSEKFDTWSTERSELFIEVFFNEINDVADNLQCDVEQFKQAFIHLSKEDDWGYGVRELFTNLCKCEKKKIKTSRVKQRWSDFVQEQHDNACVLSNPGMEMFFEKLGITNAVDCRELGPIYLSRVSLVKEKGWKIKSTLCDDVFLARNSRVESKEDGLPRTRYQRSPAESHQ